MTQNVFELPAPTAREVFAVDGTRVTLDPRHGWECPCSPGAPKGSQCAHVEQARVYRSKRAPPRDRNTIEIELTAQQLSELCRAVPAEYRDITPVKDIVRSERVTRRRSPWAPFAAAAAIAGISSGITYMTVSRADPMVAAQPPLAAAVMAPLPVPAALPAELPVKFVNPFDRGEVFEFPSGTSASAAREAVAEILVKRAQKRLDDNAGGPRTSTAVNREKPVHHPEHVAQRS